MIKAILLFVAVLAFGIAPFVVPPFTGYDPAMFPVQIARPSIQPAGYAFAIWSIIYLWLIAHAAFGLWRRAEDPAWDAVRLPLAAAALIGAVWMSIAAASPVWGTVTIWLMALAAVEAFVRADPVQDRWLLCAPTAIFAGWLSAAAAVSTGVLVAGYGWLSDTGSAVAMLALILGLAVSVQRLRPRMPVYGLTVIWALGGIVQVNWGQNQTVAILAALAAAVMVATLLLTRRA